MSLPSTLSQAPTLFEPHVETIRKINGPSTGRIMVHIVRYPFMRDGVPMERTYCGVLMVRKDAQSAVNAIRETYCKRCTELRSKA